MPIYVYKCECGKEIEKLRKVDDRDAPLQCVTCGEEMKRAASQTSDPSFKGSGWTPKFY